jgi:hypothetical protein
MNSLKLTRGLATKYDMLDSKFNLYHLIKMKSSAQERLKRINDKAFEVFSNNRPEDVSIEFKRSWRGISNSERNTIYFCKEQLKTLLN